MGDRSVLLLAPHWREMDELFSPEVQDQLHGAFEVIWGRDAPMPEAELQAALARADYFVSATPQLDAARVAAAPRLKAVIEASGSFPSTIDYDACFARGIHVLSCAPGFQRSVAEMALGMAISGARGLVAEHEGFRRGDEAWLSDVPGRDFTLFGADVGFVGFGAIAREILRLLEPFGVRPLAYDPFLPPGAGVETVALEDLARRSRCIFVCAAPTRENKGMLGSAFFDAMGRGALLVVVSRAHLVDFPALKEAVASGHIRAAIDVFPLEPVPADDPLRQMDGVILSPHRAAAVKGGRQMIGDLILQDLLRLERGEDPCALGRANRQVVALVAGVGEDEPVSELIPRGEQG